MFQKQDVIIIGAGPSGAMAAYSLATRGVSVLILEKSVFPRYKVCGGGLTHKIIREVPYDLSPVFESGIHAIRFSCCFKEEFIRRSDEPMIYCTMRDRLDELMVNQALAAGGRIEFGEKVTEVRQENRGMIVKTARNTYESTVVIGADGASGICSHQIDLHRDLISGMAWEAELAGDPDELKLWGQTVFLDWGTLYGGYAWVFPKNDHFSVGVGGPATLAGHMMAYYAKFLRSTGIGFGTQHSIRAWPIPVKVKKSRFHKGTMLLAGDAGGLTDPLTGEGIYYAIRSGKIAAETSVLYLSGNILSMDQYSFRINDELMPELLEAGNIRRVFHALPKTIHRLVRDRERVWNAFGKILRGERDYRDVPRGLGRWSALWGVVCFLSGIVVRGKNLINELNRENRMI